MVELQSGLDFCLLVRQPMLTTGRSSRRFNKVCAVEPVGRKLGVADGVLDVLVAEIGLQYPRIMPRIQARRHLVNHICLCVID
jgi:hypothetical protein